MVGRSKISNKINERNFGTFHKLPEELQQSLILFGKENASRLQKSFDDALEAQQEAHCQKEEIALHKKLEQMQGDYITVIYFYVQYHLSRCWRTLDDEDNNYKKLCSEGKILKGI
jgi:hypothetical protein